jgi:hypothetical protein
MAPPESRTRDRPAFFGLDELDMVLHEATLHAERIESMSKRIDGLKSFKRGLISQAFSDKNQTPSATMTTLRILSRAKSVLLGEREVGLC